MNLVEQIRSELTGEVSKQLGGLIGMQGGTDSLGSGMEKLIGTLLPTILSGLSGVASTKTGAEKLSQTIEGMDPSSFGNLGSLLASSGSTGGNVLSNLISGKAVDAIASVVAKFLGMDEKLIKAALGYLTPLVLGSIGASTGGKTGVSGITKLFEDQKSNIASAMPPGLKFDGVPSLNGILGATSDAVTEAKEEPSNVGKWLVPLALVAAIAASAYFIMNPGEKPTSVPAGGGNKPASVQSGEGLAPPGGAESANAPDDSKTNKK